MVSNTQSPFIEGAGKPEFDLLALTMVTGEKIDLTPFLVVLNIYEDMFSPVLTGSITINDTIGLFDRVPLCGQEKLTVKVYSHNYSLNNDALNFLHRTFDVVRITDVKQVNDYTKQLTLHFVSPELVKSETTKISRGFKDKLISRVVFETMTSPYDVEEPLGLGFPPNDEFLGSDTFTNEFIDPSLIEKRVRKVNDDDAVELFIERTKHSDPRISFPYMKPLDVIMWLASKSLRGVATEQEAANFVFFENKRGFQFVSIDTMLESKIHSNTVFKFGSGKQNISFDNNRQVYTETINKLQIQDCYDLIKNIRNGVYASRLYTYDISNGQTLVYDYDYSEHFYKSQSTERDRNSSNNDFSILKEGSDLTTKFHSKRMFVIQNPAREYDNILSEQTDRYNTTNERTGVEEYLQQRVSQLARLSNFRLLLEISGNSKHKVGDCVKIDLKSWKPPADHAALSKTIDFQEESNKYYSGYYLITSIKHTINKFEYKMNIEAVKDSYKTQIG